MDTDGLLDDALAFAMTLRRHCFAEAIGQLILAFSMDVVSAKALMIIVHEQDT